MKVIATTSEQMLEAVLYRLQMTGWARVDFEKLVDVFLDFRFQVRRCVYHLQSGPTLRDHMRAAVEADIVSLERQSRATRTTSRVWLTPLGLKEASHLKLEQALYGSLYHSVAKLFPPLTAVRP